MFEKIQCLAFYISTFTDTECRSEDMVDQPDKHVTKTEWRSVKYEKYFYSGTFEQLYKNGMEKS